MVYRGKPSAGCEACRKAKKRCGLEQPACARCVKLKKTCSGYRDTTALQIQDESESVRQKANRHRVRVPAPASHTPIREGATKIEDGIATPRTSAHTPSSNPSSPSDETGDEYGQLITFDDDVEEPADFEWNGSSDLLVPDCLQLSVNEVATTHFFNSFTADQGHWTYLREMARGPQMDPALDFAVRACGMAALNNVKNVTMGREYSRMFYGEALGLLNSALRDPKRSKTDETLLAVAVLGYYENLTAEGRQSIQSWKAHINGATQLLQLRGKKQFRSPIGRMLFREARAGLLVHCIWDDVEPPDFMWALEKELADLKTPSDAYYAVDDLAMVLYEFATIRAKMRTQEITDQDALERIAQVEMRMVQWSIVTMDNYPEWGYHEVEVNDSPHVWNNLVHSYSLPAAAGSWNTYRSMRIMVTRVQEMLYRRLNNNIKSDDAQMAYFHSVRRQMTDEICYGIPPQLGHASPAPNSPCILITAYNSIWPLFFAGTCTLERVGTNYFANGAPSITSAASAQTLWIIGRMEYISKQVGLRWADGIVALLKGDFGMHGDMMEPEDKDFIQLYWRERAKREEKEARLVDHEPGANAPKWVKRIQQSGKSSRDSSESGASDRKKDLGPLWQSRALGAPKQRKR